MREAAPAAEVSSRATKASRPPPWLVSYAPALTGNPAPARPVTYACPVTSSATASAWSAPAPPRYVA
ncbi:MAG: hypothetical protein QM767_17055 [Anaeromyxobacter sp.]